MENQFSRQRIKTADLPELLKIKWTEKILDEGFVSFPKRLLRCMSQLFHGENGVIKLAIVLAIVDYLRPNPTRWPSIGYLSFISGISPDVLHEQLLELQKMGYVTVGGTEDKLELSIEGLLKKIEKLTGPTAQDQ